MPKVCLTRWVVWIAAFGLCNLSIHAEVRYWTNGLGGSFSVPSNWSPNIVPGASDTVLFTNTGGYGVTFDVSALNQAALFSSGSITQSVSSHSWQLSDEFRVGEISGATSRVTVASGTLVVTNAAGNATLSVGGQGTGEFAIRGGNVVADKLSATNGARSILTLSHGVLSTLRGSVISNGGKLFLGSPSNTFIWNILGGTNSIITGQFAYGGLTFGDAGPAVVGIEGPSTVLNVPGIDSAGGHRLFVHSGAKLHTRHVQWGLGGSGTSNLIVISGAGSSWINDYLFQFGMHAGYQTMIISNGGYFQTGGPAFSDMRFSMDHTGDRIIVTGSNSWFNSLGNTELGQVICTPRCELDSLIVITNGGRFSAWQLRYGLPGSAPGNVIDVADGTLAIRSLNFAVGTLRIGAGSGTIDELNMAGDTNAILQLQGNLLVGHQGEPGAGNLRIGGPNVSIPSLSGELRTRGWKLGSYVGDSGSVTMAGGRAFVTNSAGNAVLVIGDQGAGVLRVDSGQVYADRVHVSAASGSSGQLALSGSATALYSPDLEVGAGGTVSVNNAALLRIERCISPPLKVSIGSGILEFGTGAPAIAQNAITTTNGAIISFRGVASVPIGANDSAYLGRILRTGRTVLRLVDSTNTWQSSVAVQDNDAASWPGLILMGQCGIQGDHVVVDTSGILSATNSVTTISGNFTNSGTLQLHKSTLRFVGPATLSSASQFTGLEGVLLFDGGLHLPANDIVIPQGISIRAASITSAGGRLVLNGGGIIPSGDGSMYAGTVMFQSGWVTYFDTSAAPTTVPAWLAHATSVGLELIRSTNAALLAHTFLAGAGGFDRLRLGTGSTWHSQELTIGYGAGMFLADPSASVALSSGVFRVADGGWFRDETGFPSYVGFSPLSSDSRAVVSGTGSAWITTNVLSIGSAGSRNQLLIEQAGRVFSSAGFIGPNADNTVILDGQGSAWFSTNGVTLQGFRNQLIVRTGAQFFGSQILITNGGKLLLDGAGAVASCGGPLRIRTQGQLSITNGAQLFTSDGRLEAFTSMADVSGFGSLWRVNGSLSITSATFFSEGNQVFVQDGGVISASNIFLLASTFGLGVPGALSIRSGSLFVTNGPRNGTLAVNGRLTLSRGLLLVDNLTANNASGSRINIHAGVAQWRSCDLAQGIPLRIGDGTNQATLNLLGGTNICRSGMVIGPHAALKGHGVVIGALTNRGVVWPSAVAVRGNFVSDSIAHTVFSIAASPGSPENSSLLVTGRVTLAGQLAIELRSDAPPSPQDTYALVQYGSVASAFSNVAFGQRLLTLDGLGSFRIQDTGSAIVATDFQSEDLDGDAIRDAWAQQYFALTPLPSGTTTNALDGDLDGDGLSNRDEFTMQTDPADPSSSFRLRIERSAIGVKISFPYLFGPRYSIFASGDLMTWSESSAEDLQFDTNGMAVWVDAPGLSASRQAYRIARQ